MVGAAVLTGVVAALLAQAAVSAGLPVFSDGWHLLPAPPGLTPVTLLVAVGVIVVVIGVAALAGAARLVRAGPVGASGGVRPDRPGPTRAATARTGSKGGTQ